MHKFFVLYFLLLPGFLLAKPYFVEYRDGYKIIIFKGDINQADELEIKHLQILYLENLHDEVLELHYRKKLSALGVDVKHIDDNPFIPSDTLKDHYPTTRHEILPQKNPEQSK